jgi:hypothetical protein
MHLRAVWTTLSRQSFEYDSSFFWDLFSHTKTSELTRLSWLDLAIQQPESQRQFS